MKRTLIYSILLTLAMIFVVEDVTAQRKARKKRRQNYQNSKSKAAFKPATINMYSKGVINLGASYGQTANRHNGFITGDYYFTDRIYGSVSLGYIRDQHYNVTRNLFPLIMEGVATLYQINNTIFFNARAGGAASLQSIKELEPTGESKTILYSGSIGGEIMIHVLWDLSAFGHIRQLIGINENNHQVIYSVGIKKRLRF